jgi:hypothetical protein
MNTRGEREERGEEREETVAGMQVEVSVNSKSLKSN